MDLGFIDLEKVYVTTNMEALWQILRLYGVGGKLLNSIKGMHTNRFTYVRVKGIKNESFRTDRGVRQ